MSQNPSWNNESNLVIILLNIFTFHLNLRYPLPFCDLTRYISWKISGKIFAAQHCSFTWGVWLFKHRTIFYSTPSHTALIYRFAPLCASSGPIPWQLGWHCSPGTSSLFTAPFSISLLAWAGFWPPHTLFWALYSCVFIHPSARVMLRLGYMRTYVQCHCIEIRGTDGRLLPQRNTNPFI